MKPEQQILADVAAAIAGARAVERRDAAAAADVLDALGVSDALAGELLARCGLEATQGVKDVLADAAGATLKGWEL